MTDIEVFSNKLLKDMKSLKGMQEQKMLLATKQLDSIDNKEQKEFLSEALKNAQKGKLNAIDFSKQLENWGKITTL